MVSNPKNFYKKNFYHYSNKYKQGGNSSSEKTRYESLKNSQNGDEKKEKKLMGDYGYDYKYCRGKNHFSKECTLRGGANEKKESKKDET